MCAAGSGKTWSICNEALANANDAANGKRILITTYTNKGVDTVNGELAKQNLGVPSQRITVRTWYQFLLAELIRPYQSHIVGINQIKAFDFSDRYGQVNYGKEGETRRYFSGKQQLVKKDSASELAVYLNKQSLGSVISRLEKVYSHIYIDEMQDMAGHDLSIVEMLFDSRLDVICVGDNKQATYSTHNARKNKRKAGRNLWEFCADKQKDGVATIEENMVSRRFNSNICAFANAVYPNAKNITTSMTKTTGHDGVFIIERSDMEQYLEHYNPVVLKYDRRTDVGGVPSYNYGECKGMTFDRVLLYPTKPLTGFLAGKELTSQERYYVAVTRPRYSLAIVVDKIPTSTVFEPVDIPLGDMTIYALRFVERGN
jgi:superfamily I DNA/RNA helicase